MRRNNEAVRGNRRNPNVRRDKRALMQRGCIDRYTLVLFKGKNLIILTYRPGMVKGISLFSMSLRLAISQAVKNTNFARFAIRS